MKLIKFKDGLYPMEANLVTVGDNSHFNVSHGTRLMGGWAVTFGVDDKIVSGELNSNEYMIELKEEDYILLPIYKFGTREQKLDVRNNKKYFISRNQSEDNSSVLLFLNLPNVEGCTYKMSGMGRQISMGTKMVYGESESYSSDAPIILLEGNTIILISYVLDEKTIEEKIIFRNKQLQHIRD